MTHSYPLDSYVKGLVSQNQPIRKNEIMDKLHPLEIIGEATKIILESMRDKYPEIPWKSMAGMRDKLIHAYFGVRLELVWNTASELLPPLKMVFTQIYNEIETSDAKEE